MNNKLLISFSGGRTSAYMTWWLMNQWSERGNWDLKVVFANTGKEREETLQFVNECDIKWQLGVVWVEADVHHDEKKSSTATIVDFGTASRFGEPFEQVIIKYGLPNQSFPHCTRELKTKPIHAYIKSIGWKDYHTAIGIRADEFDRMNPDRKKLKYLYPLVDNNITVWDVNKFWRQQNFDLKLKSYQGNCDLCWKKSIPKLQLICKENPSVMNWWRLMEAKYSTFIPAGRKQTQLPITIYRGNRALEQILAIKKKNFEQTELFEFGCSETCEPF